MIMLPISDSSVQAYSDVGSDRISSAAKYSCGIEALEIPMLQSLAEVPVRTISRATKSHGPSLALLDTIEPKRSTEKLAQSNTRTP